MVDDEKQRMLGEMKKIETQGYIVAVTDSSYNQPDHSFENGMSIFYLLSDGTFLIYDGGQGKEDSENLYKLLQKTANNNDLSKITVSAWIITHEHGDHMGFVDHFFATYKDVEVKEVWANTFYSWGKAMVETIVKNKPYCNVRIVEIGQEYNLADVKVEVLCAPEPLREIDAQALDRDNNSASIVTRLTIRGKTVLMPGDASFLAWDYMKDKYGRALKSDILQVPHHGANNAATKEVYDLIDAQTLLFPCGDRLYETLLNKGDYYVCKQGCPHDLYNTHTHALVEDFKGQIIVAGTFDFENPVIKRFI